MPLIVAHSLTIISGEKFHPSFLSVAQSFFSGDKHHHPSILIGEVLPVFFDSSMEDEMTLLDRSQYVLECRKSTGIQVLRLLSCQ